MSEVLIETLQEQTNMQAKHIKNILKLLEEGATIPFIARYRKELTGGASDEALRAFEEQYAYTQKLHNRRDEILKLITERASLDDATKKALFEAGSLSALEDIYRPFKEKKNTRAAKAIENGLMPLANLLQSARLEKKAFEQRAQEFVKAGIKSVQEAISGAQDILAERYSDSAKEREVLRNVALRHGVLEVKAGKSFDEKGLYKNFVGSSEKVAFIPSHRFLAIARGVAQKELSMKVRFELERTLENIRRFKVPRDAKSSKKYAIDAYEDGLKRLLLPSIEREVLGVLKERSDTKAIETFGKNLTQLLLAPPVTQKVLLGVDPAYKTGCKLAVIDEYGKYLEHGVIFPTPPQNAFKEAKEKVLTLLKRYNITGVAIGNGTASRETQAFFARLNKEEGCRLAYTVVSEAGASVYSASKLAAKEYPNLDVTIRGAISIAQRLRDPMAALVKIEPKALGIGQYQHDVDQKRLEKKLHEAVEDLVNKVGVDVNSASASLLSYVAGIGPKLAEAIISHRESRGAFKHKAELLKVKGLGTKAYEQCAGFLRIREGSDILDNTGIHPESFEVARKVLTLLKEHKSVDAKALAVGEETLKDILTELKKPGFDLRQDLPAIPFKEDVLELKDLKVGSVVSGVVRNLTDFGAFVDIGLKNDALLHISQMSDKRIKHPLEAVSVNQYLPRVEILSIESEKEKVSLTLKSS